MVKVITAKIAYKTIPKGFKSQGHQWKLGKWYKTNGELVLCENGFHASKLLPNAFWYVIPYWVCEVEYKGEVIEDTDKLVASEMRVIKRYRWKQKDSVTLTVACAKRVLKHYEVKFPDDLRPRRAIEAAEAWLKKPSRKNRIAARNARSAARSAVWSAENAAKSARSAAKSAESVAESAARSAAWSTVSAAWSAARSAVWSAESAAWSASWSATNAAWSAKSAAECAESAANNEIKWQHKKILEIIKTNGKWRNKEKC